MSAKENKAIIRRWIEAYNERDLEAEAAVLAPGLVVHVSAAAGPLEGLGAWRQFSGSFGGGFTGLRITVQDIAADGDTVAARLAFHASPRGEFPGTFPPFKEASLPRMESHRVGNGKV